MAISSFKRIAAAAASSSSSVPLGESVELTATVSNTYLGVEAGLRQGTYDWSKTSSSRTVVILSNPDTGYSLELDVDSTTSGSIVIEEDVPSIIFRTAASSETVTFTKTAETIGEKDFATIPIQEISTSGTYTFANSILALAIGGGGNGGNLAWYYYQNGNSLSSGGGGSGYVDSDILPPGTYDIVIGGSGGTTSISRNGTTYLSAGGGGNGGSGRQNQFSENNGSPGGGGSGGGGGVLGGGSGGSGVNPYNDLFMSKGEINSNDVAFGTSSATRAGIYVGGRNSGRGNAAGAGGGGAAYGSGNSGAYYDRSAGRWIPNILPAGGTGAPGKVWYKELEL